MKSHSLEPVSARTRRRADAPLDIMADVNIPVPLGNRHKLPLRFLSAAHSSPRKPEYFDLGILEPFGPLAHEMAADFLQDISSKKLGTARARLASTRRQFKSVAERYEPSWTAIEWHQAFEASADAIRNDETIKATTRNQYIKNANLFARFLQDRGTIPRFNLPLGVENAFLANQPKPAVSEIPVAVQASSTQSFHLRGADEDTVKTWDQLSELMNISDPAVMHARLIILLRHIRTLAINGVRAHQIAHQAALSQISATEHARIVKFIAENDGRFSRSLGSGRGSKSAFVDMSSILSFIEYEHGGIPPTRFEAPAFCRLLYNRFSVRDIQYQLFLSTETSIYYLIIILLDTAMNISSALELEVSSIEDLGANGLHKLKWYKTRHGEDQISDFFERPNCPDSENLGVVEVIYHLLSLNRRLRDFALHNERDKLFLVGNLVGPRGKLAEYRVGGLSETLESKSWQRIRARDRILSKIPISLDMIRSSVLLLECLETNYNLFSINKKAHHAGYASTIRYMRRITVTSLNVSQVREVQDFIIATATERQPEIRVELGIGPEHAAAIIAKARRKGFGSWSNLKNQSASSERRADAKAFDDTLSAIERWMVAGDKLLIADAEVAAEIIAFRLHILREKSLLEPTPAWLETWAPLLIFLNHAAEEMTARLRARGEQIAAEMDIFYEDLD